MRLFLEMVYDASQYYEHYYYDPEHEAVYQAIKNASYHGSASCWPPSGPNTRVIPSTVMSQTLLD